jgi:thymidylate kinase
MYYVVVFIASYLSSVHFALVRSTLVVGDRYYHDLTIDSRRYRYGGPPWLAKLACILIPSPSLWFILEAAPEVIQTRKREIDERELRRQLEGYRAFAQQLRSARLIRTDASLESAVTAMLDAIVDHMSVKTRERLRLP